MQNILFTTTFTKVIEEDGQGMVEYALIIGFVALAVFGVLFLIGPALAEIFQEMLNELQLII